MRETTPTQELEYGRRAVRLLAGIYLAMLAAYAFVASGCAATVQFEAFRGAPKPAPVAVAVRNEAASDREMFARFNCDLAAMSAALVYFAHVPQDVADQRALDAFNAGAGTCSALPVAIPAPPERGKKK